MGTQLTLPKGAHTLSFLAQICCGQTAGWIKMPLGVEVGLGQGNIVLDGDPAPPKNGHSTPLLGPYLLWPNGRPSQLLMSTCCQKFREVMRLKIPMQFLCNCQIFFVNSLNIIIPNTHKMLFMTVQFMYLTTAANTSVYRPFFEDNLGKLAPER